MHMPRSLHAICSLKCFCLSTNFLSCSPGSNFIQHDIPLFYAFCKGGDYIGGDMTGIVIGYKLCKILDRLQL